MPHPALHRALRELGATTRQLADHWDSLAPTLGDDGAVLQAGAVEARELLMSVAPVATARDIPVGPAARAVGARLAGVRGVVGDRLLERNQALRLAVLDVQHVVTLLGYVERLARTEDDADLAAACEAWIARLRTREEEVRNAAVAIGGRPDEAVLPARPGTAGRLGHRLQGAIGAAGEWTDRRLTRR